MPPEPPRDPPGATPDPGQIQRAPFKVDPQAIADAKRVDRSHQRPRLADLSGEKWAGVWLAVGVLCIMTLFLSAALLYLRTAEPPACKMLAS